MYKILLAEDDREIANLERDYLSMNEYEVDIAYDGEEAEEKLKSVKYDIIHFLRREMLNFTAFPVFFVSNLLLVQRKKILF